MSQNIPQIVNRKAKFEYNFLQNYEAGVMLCGTEVKSLRLGNANMKDAYCLFIGNELYIKNLYISEYEYGNINNHETTRDRKLLLRKSELKKLQRKVSEKGFTIVPYKIFWSDRGIVKIEIFLATGKKTHDKRQHIKEKDLKRETDRMLKMR